MNRLLGSVALIAGTAIGAGMLSLPVVTASMGLVPSLIVFALMGLLMGYVALLILEVISILPTGATMISMASDTMGPWGRAGATVSYFFLLLMLNIAYLSGATHQILAALGWELSLLSRGVVGVFLSFGCGWLAAAHTERVDKVNRWLFAALVASFAGMALIVLPSVQLPFLTSQNWSMALVPIALILTSFGYHPIIPNIFDYLGRDIRRTRQAIIMGTIVPFVVYAIWQFMVLGSVPIEAPRGLRWAFESGLPATAPLSAHNSGSSLTILSSCFALLAILTSFLGTMLALAEFVADACGWPITPKTKPRIALAIAGPLLLFSLVGTRLFIEALGYAGIWAAILLGCLPVIMAALARRSHSKEQRPYLVKGGYVAMLLAFICFTVVIAIELRSHF